MHALALVVTIYETVPLLTGRIAKDAAHTTEKEHKDQCPHAASNAGALSIYFCEPFVSTRRTYMLKRLFIGSKPQFNFVDS